MVINNLFMLNRFRQFYAFVACLLFLYSRHNFLMHAFRFEFIYTHVFISASHLTFTWPLVGELLTRLDLHVQVLKLGLKWSPSSKIKLTSQSRLASPNSICSRLFQLAREIPSELVSIFYIVHIVNLTFVPGRNVMYL